MKKKTFYTSVPIDSHGGRIDKFLQSQLNTISRTRLQNLIRDGNIKLNNTVIYEVSKKISFYYSRYTLENFHPIQFSYIQIFDQIYLYFL